MTSPDEALASIPGWNGATWSVLAGGISNRSYLLQAAGRRAVLKIDDAPRRSPLNSRRDEFDIQTRAASARLANRPLYADETLYLSDYVDGQVWSDEELRKPEHLRLLARALRELHSLPPSGRKFDALAAAQQYANAIGPDRSNQTALHLDVIRETPRTNENCFCHNDLVAENILMANRLRFLDWEYACDNDPLFDLATVVAHHELEQRHADILLSTYFGERFATDRTTILQGLGWQTRLYESLVWLWAAARSNLGSERGSEQGSDH